MLVVDEPFESRRTMHDFGVWISLVDDLVERIECLSDNTKDVVL